MICLHCGLTGPDGNHCRSCLWSQHWVDNGAWPRYRVSACRGLMRPESVWRGIVFHRCERCGQESRASLGSDAP